MLATAPPMRWLRRSRTLACYAVPWTGSMLSPSGAAGLRAIQPLRVPIQEFVRRGRVDFPVLPKLPQGHQLRSGIVGFVPDLFAHPDSMVVGVGAFVCVPEDR
jgi:hypothetical protein